MKKNFDLYETIKGSVKEALLEVLAQMYGVSTLEAGSESGSDDDGGSGNNEGEDDNDSNNNNGAEDKDKKDPIRPKPNFGIGGFSLRN